MAHIRPVAQIREELLPTRQSLLSRLKDWDDDDSWKAFFDTYWKLIYRTATKAGLTEVEAQDVVQETVISVSKSIKSFEYRSENGSFKSWLLQLTRWRINDQFKKRQKGIVTLSQNDRSVEDRPQSTNGALEETAEQFPEPVSEASWEEVWEWNLLEAALGRLRRRVDSRQYQVFHQIVLKGQTVKEVARSLKISQPKIYMIKHRLNRQLKKEIAYLRTKPV